MRVPFIVSGVDRVVVGATADNEFCGVGNGGCGVVDVVRMVTGNIVYRFSLAGTGLFTGSRQSAGRLCASRWRLWYYVDSGIECGAACFVAGAGFSQMALFVAVKCNLDSRIQPATNKLDAA